MDVLAAAAGYIGAAGHLSSENFAVNASNVVRSLVLLGFVAAAIVAGQYVGGLIGTLS